MGLNYKLKGLVIGLLLIIVNAAYAYDNGDFQVWNTDVQEIKINDKSKAALEEEFRWGDNANEFYYQHYDIAWIYALSKSWDLKLSYRYILEKKSGKFKVENEPNINATYKWNFLGCDMSNRFRLEYRNFDYQTDFWRYRNMLAIRAPWKFTKFQIRPFVADDLFINSKGASIHNNRFYSGLGFKLFKNFDGDIFYILQHTRNVGMTKTTWRRTNVFGVRLRAIF